ncbi:19692_t:CDS:2 [Gigaspora margarita]|uniref:19692_t:CDS:1 n=1 Tax=Gigaspora margarita TaxID=4874 RepID=A0ABM8VW01_GIGMA|nr:19692_t:CDS:2 [Gigaspora margarita]
MDQRKEETIGINAILELKNLVVNPIKNSFKEILTREHIIARIE